MAWRDKKYRYSPPGRDVSPPPPAPNISSGDGFLEPIYTPGWREAQTIKNTLYDTKYA